MSILNSNCSCRCSCTVIALIVSAIIGVLAAFFQVTAVIAITPVFLAAALGVALVYLGALTVTAALAGSTGRRECLCTALNTVLAGILGTIVFSVVLLIAGITATSVISAILTGVLVFFITLTVTATVCLVRTLSDCAE